MLSALSSKASIYYNSTALNTTMIGTLRILPANGIIVQARSYVSRAHPKPTPVYSIYKAVELLLEKAAERVEYRKASSIHWKKEFFHSDETVELVLSLNLDPRKPGQALRGTIRLPHGTGRKVKCIVFTDNADTAKRALEKGAVHAGGEELIDDIADGKIKIDKIDRGLGILDIVPSLSKKVARTLGPRGLMPNVKTGTLLKTNEELEKALDLQIMGREVVYRTETDGQIHIPVGKISFGLTKLLDNIGEAVKELHAVKPEQYGKGKKPKSANTKGLKYVLQSYLSSTQGPGFKLDLKTLEPNGAFFLQDPDMVKAALSGIKKTPPPSTITTTGTEEESAMDATSSTTATSSADSSPSPLTRTTEHTEVETEEGETRDDASMSEEKLHSASE
ncbi:hypothetical protein ACA910_000609 [Epithemia clementina (nom. ined.)]